METYIVDGSGFLFRAYHGLPPLTDDQGREIHVLYGFVSMMLTLLHDEPDLFVIARDAPSKTVRHDHFSGYKANRPKAPDDLKRQIQATQELVEKLGLPTIMVPGYEADDIIATVAIDRAGHGDQVTVVSSDKDLKQLIRQNIQTLDTMKKNRTTYTSFVDEMRFEPKYLLDYLALIGDASDNIPGVAGIGPKTAQGLIEKYHTLEAVYDHIDELPPGIQRKLTTNRDNAIMSKRLIELLHTPGCEGLAPADLTRIPQRDALEQTIIYDYGFRRLAKKLQSLKNQYMMPTQTGLF